MVGWEETPQPGSPEDVDEVLRRKLRAALATNSTFLALASPTNAQVLAQVKALTRQNVALIRVVAGLLDATTDA